MPVIGEELAKFDGKQVILHVIQDDGSAAELEGKVEAASESGLAFREKGKRDVDLLEPSQIEEIALAPAKPKKVTQKKLKPISEQNIRQHLVDRHGMTRTEAGQLTDAEAFEKHENIDHADLGHRHVMEDEDDNSESESAEDAA